MTDISPSSMSQTQQIADRLKRMPRVVETAKRRAGSSVDAEAWQIATALVDIQESTNRIFTELVPKLLIVSPEEQAAEDLLNDIGEEYRHILYHIRDTKLFDYIWSEEEQHGQST